MKGDMLLRKRRAVWVVVALLACGAAPARAYDQELKKLAADLAARIAPKHTRVTVVDFVDLDRKPSRLGQFLAMQLQAAMAEPGHKLEIVDQSQLPQLFDQVELYDEGLLDPATRRELGRISATEVVVLGTVMPSSLSIRLDIKAIDLQTAKMIGSGTAKLARLGLLAQLANAGERAGAKADSADEGGDGEDGAEAPVAVPAKTKGGKAPPRSLSVQGVLFDLEGCALNGDGLTCALTVTSQGRGRSFFVSPQSRAWNDGGDEYGPTTVKIANTQSRHDEECLGKEVLEDLKTPLVLTFSKFDDESALVERLRLVWREDDDCWRDNSRSVEFEKIALSQDGDVPSSSAKALSGGGKAGGSGSIWRRTLRIIEDTAAETIQQKLREAAGTDKEEKEEPPQ